jgi:HD superfamily phosphohydrolase
MTDINPQYLELTKLLNGTRKSLAQLCADANIDTDRLDYDLLRQHIDQCSHCNIWTTKPIQDLDGNPICKVCEQIAGL